MDVVCCLAGCLQAPSSALRPTSCLLLGLGLAAPGFHSDGCLETKHHISRSLYRSLPIKSLWINQEVWSLPVQKAREERIVVFASQNLGTTGVGEGGYQERVPCLFSPKPVCCKEQELGSWRELVLAGCPTIPSGVNLDSDLNPSNILKTKQGWGGPVFLFSSS